MKIIQEFRGGIVFERGFGETLKQFGVDGPVCHVGSKVRDIDQDAAARNRTIAYSCLANREVVGVDIESGTNVEVVADLCSPSLFSEHPQLRGYFGLVRCSALLEHVINPFDAARNIQALLRPGGHLLISGPWVHGFHSYPDDYWRISISGLKVLFPEVQFIEWWYEAHKKNVRVRIDDLSQERGFFSEIVDLKKLGRYITDRALPYLNIGAIGVKIH